MASQPAPVSRMSFGYAFRLLAQTALIMAISLFVLVQRGPTMCDPFFLLPFSLFSCLLVPPILIKEFRQHPDLPARQLAAAASTRASSAVLLILGLSLALANLAFWEGRPLLPSPETAAWTVVLCITAALAAAAGCLVFRTVGAINTLKWLSRTLALAVVVLYKYMPDELWAPWYGLVFRWGITTTALAFEIALVSITTGALVVLKHRESLAAPILPDIYGPPTTQ